MSDPRTGRAGISDQNGRPGAFGLIVTQPADLAHGTVAELESWLRALATGRPWYAQPTCPVCRRALERAA